MTTEQFDYRENRLDVEGAMKLHRSNPIDYSFVIEGSFFKLYKRVSSLNRRFQPVYSWVKVWSKKR